MGPLGWQETVFIFVLALLIFGPKKLPELGRNVAKAIGEFRRASSDLKAQFDREMASIETETKSLKEVTQSYASDIQNTYNYDSYYDTGYDSGYSSTQDSASATTTSSVGAAATSGADSPTQAPEGTVAQGSVPVGEPEEGTVETAQAGEPRRTEDRNRTGVPTDEGAPLAT
ncbi:MAG: twin-arginine translocase TatA/TatE family subunit [Bryobacteraceae bacterium]|nr:twin-arginine translocase TatA/TatE family subunit [Bryobacteraceae bacterium]